VLRINPFLATAQFGGFTPAFELFNYFVQSLCSH
jgi:hypothetical protein